MGVSKTVNKKQLTINNLKRILNDNSIAIGLIIIAILLRVLPHPANFAPVGAVALFAGVYLKKSYAVWLPLTIMIVSDFFIGLHSVVAFTWGSFVLIGLIGLWVRERKNVPNIIFGTLTGSFLFFFITNFGVWGFTPLYAKTWQGLVQCYVMAIPFFRNTVLSDFFFVAVLFGAYEAATYLMRKFVKEGIVKEKSSIRNI